MNETEEKLIEETEKWKEELEKVIPEIEPENEKEEKALENIKAYINDTEHFKSEGDYIRAFEACIWAWSAYEMIFDFMKE